MLKRRLKVRKELDVLCVTAAIRWMVLSLTLRWTIAVLSVHSNPNAVALMGEVSSKSRLGL